MEISFCPRRNCNKVIAMKSRTWHDSFAVVACVKICSGMMHFSLEKMIRRLNKMNCQYVFYIWHITWTICCRYTLISFFLSRDSWYLNGCMINGYEYPVSLVMLVMRKHLIFSIVITRAISYQCDYLRPFWYKAYFHNNWSWWKWL